MCSIEFFFATKKFGQWFLIQWFLLPKKKWRKFWVERIITILERKFFGHFERKKNGTWVIKLLKGSWRVGEKKSLPGLLPENPTYTLKKNGKKIREETFFPPKAVGGVFPNTTLRKLCPKCSLKPLFFAKKKFTGNRI